MRSNLSYIAGLALLMMAAPAANAAIISGTYTVSGLAGGPVFPAVVTFTIAFDNSMNQTTDSTSGISLVSSNLVIADDLGFTYDSTSDLLVIGSTLNQVGGVFGMTNDFRARISTFSTVPTLQSFVYSQGGLVYTGFQGSVSTVSAIGEPVSLALYGFGTAILALAGRRRRPGRSMTASETR